MLYDWLRAGHIISVIAWMAGLLMAPRLLIYRLEGQDNEQLTDAMDLAALRLQKIILTPAMLLSWVFGISMIALSWQFLTLEIWFWIKITLVLILSGIHGYFSGLRKKVIVSPESVSSKKLRLFNEAPFVLAIFIVIMVVVEPF